MFWFLISHICLCFESQLHCTLHMWRVAGEIYRFDAFKAGKFIFLIAFICMKGRCMNAVRYSRNLEGFLIKSGNFIAMFGWNCDLWLVNRMNLVASYMSELMIIVLDKSSFKSTSQHKRLQHQKFFFPEIATRWKALKSERKTKDSQ